VTNEQLISGDLADALTGLWDQPKPEVPVAQGALEAAEYLARML
jgi:hypothetical protein